MGGLYAGVFVCEGIQAPNIGAQAHYRSESSQDQKRELKQGEATGGNKMQRGHQKWLGEGGNQREPEQEA